MTTIATRKRYERPTIVKQQSGLMNKIGRRSYAAPVTDLDGVPVSRLAAEFGSPLFVLSEKKLRQNMRRAVRVFSTRYPQVQFAWSYKTNYLDAVCRVFHDEGSWAEVVSEFEYDKARRLGVPGSQIIFNGPGKSRQALAKAVRDGAKIHIDHFDELYALIELTGELKQTAQVAIRINMDVGIHPAWDRFGFNYENGEAWQAITRVMGAAHLRLAGLHTHIGTYIMSEQPYKIAATKLSLLAARLREQFRHRIDYIDMGGGFASTNTLLGQYLSAEGTVPTLEQYADAIAAGLAEHAPAPADAPALYLETGRALVDDAGHLITTVIANKRLSDNRRAVIVDAGVNLLFTSFWYRHNISPTLDHGTLAEDTVLYGPLCMNIDQLREQVTLPPLKVGEHLVIHHTGAYDVTQWMQFITLRPNIVMILEDGAPALIRRAETLESLVSHELVPAKLQGPSA